MQKWKYLTASVVTVEGKGFLVLRKDGKPLFTETISKTDYSKCPTWENFLAWAGGNGWELVSFSGEIYSQRETYPAVFNYTTLHAVFKQPKQ
jgi:hypothetical protein